VQRIQCHPPGIHHPHPDITLTHAAHTPTSPRHHPDISRAPPPTPPLLLLATHHSPCAPPPPPRALSLLLLTPSAAWWATSLSTHVNPSPDVPPSTLHNPAPCPTPRPHPHPPRQRGLVGDIIKRFEARGYTLKGLKLINVERGLAEKHYADLSSKPFFPALVDYIIRWGGGGSGWRGGWGAIACISLCSPCWSTSSQRGLAVGGGWVGRGLLPVSHVLSRADACPNSPPVRTSPHPTPPHPTPPHPTPHTPLSAAALW
jgi:hypothetical protein